MSQPSTPTRSASMSMTPSIANWAWLLPKPRIAPRVRVVRVDRLRFDVDVRNAVHAARVARGAQRALGARRVIAAGIRDDARPQREQMAVRVGADRELDGHRVALDVMLRRLLAREHRLHRPAAAGSAAIAVCAWIDSSSFAPNAPPLAAARSRRPLGIEIQNPGDLLRGRTTDPWLSRVHLDAVALRHAPGTLRARGTRCRSAACRTSPR